MFSIASRRISNALLHYKYIDSLQRQQYCYPSLLTARFPSSPLVQSTANALSNASRVMQVSAEPIHIAVPILLTGSRLPATKQKDVVLYDGCVSILFHSRRRVHRDDVFDDPIIGRARECSVRGLGGR